MVYFFKKVIKAKLTLSDIYGMALKTGTIQYGHYFEVRKYDPRHDLEVELRTMQDIFNEDRQ
jgi:hypothetical protein